MLTIVYTNSHLVNHSSWPRAARATRCQKMPPDATRCARKKLRRFFPFLFPSTSPNLLEPFPAIKKLNIHEYDLIFTHHATLTIIFRFPEDFFALFMFFFWPNTALMCGIGKNLLIVKMKVFVFFESNLSSFPNILWEIEEGPHRSMSERLDG